MTGFTLTSSSSVATRDSSSKLGSPLAAPSVQHSSSKLGSAFGSRSHSSFFILHSSFKKMNLPNLLLPNLPILPNHFFLA